MKAMILVAGLLGIGMMVSAEKAEAAVQYSRTILYFDSSENLIGQSILYCSNQAEHQGTTSGPVRVTITYSCETYETNSLSYSGASAGLRSAFCDTWGQGMCDSGPWRNSDLTSPWSGGFYQ
ncbi:MULTISPECIES: hypothetical protein [Pseudoxanthomonas]|uniref:Uncharacterized protein n=1 Tax=Pseudoxanthomonas winnipegensis TaxID=2480810 RepID=A0A4V2HDM6_9GAMM|nr:MULTISPECIES: hypothetical protein [Pseudoxanthomonas]TAA28295.1 hypothetical protein EA660_01535 [Pseudoxanthomonas winnipegensis]TMN24910.1 hypothetical protein FF950_03885 [Pseudoxanthomonas sp. X-1]UAY73689.1 hypothetical protein LAJ50_14530 [Pseudoxanthomonas sp. X-1]